jgi:pimeloyl-ACP methyl ester carboxylesterase
MSPGGRGRPRCMTTFVLIPGAGSGAWIWDGVADELRRCDHDAVAVELPADADSLDDYAGAAEAAAGGHDDLVVVGQSLGAFTAAALCERVPARLLVFVAAMIPAPGESPSQWWEATGFAEATTEMRARWGPPDEWTEEALEAVFMHDVPAAVTAREGRENRPVSEGVFASSLPSAVWPSVPARVLVCRDDRFFPAAFEHRLARERLGVVADETPGGHMAMLSHPAELAGRLAGYVDG